MSDAAPPPWVRAVGSWATNRTVTQLELECLCEWAVAEAESRGTWLAVAQTLADETELTADDAEALALQIRMTLHWRPR